MTYQMFLDDVRDPPVGKPWIVVRSVAEATAYIEQHGMPAFISFDHDLGEGPTGHDLAKWLIDRHLDGNPFPPSFDFAVHSSNPPGAANITGLLNGFLRSRGLLVSMNNR